MKKTNLRYDVYQALEISQIGTFTVLGYYMTRQGAYGRIRKRKLSCDYKLFGYSYQVRKYHISEVIHY